MLKSLKKLRIPRKTLPFVSAVLAGLVAAIFFKLLDELGIFEKALSYAAAFFNSTIKTWEALLLPLVLMPFVFLLARSVLVKQLMRIPNFSISSKFGQRMLVSAHAKRTIASYCADDKTRFWRAEDVVFVESGTLPVYLLWELYHNSKRNIPKLLITNNLACSLVAMSAQEVPVSDDLLVYASDIPLPCIQLGGMVLDDYAGTLPECLFDSANTSNSGRCTIDRYLKEKCVTHVVMMCTKLTRDEGPHAASPSMRRFKKLLLKYLTENRDTRLSILVEADKLGARGGKPVDDEELAGDPQARYWRKLLKSGRVTVIGAYSPRMANHRKNLAQRVRKELKEEDAKCILLDEKGSEVS